MSLEHFHPSVSDWFAGAFEAPTPPQVEAWKAIAGGSHALVAAPTGSGKTLAAFLTAIDQLVKEAVRSDLPDEVRVIYVSPLKALSNDIQRNLETPLAAIQEGLASTTGRPVPAINAAVRTGDTPASARSRMVRQPPHILVTTPESLYILLTSESGRRMLSTARTLIVDEIHALAGTKRGAHLALSAERLQGLCPTPLTRIGLSATQEPLDLVVQFLTGSRSQQPCRVIDSGHVRQRDLELELTGSPLQAIMPGEVWGEIYDRLQQLIESHRTTLIFVNTRRMAERMAKALSERLGEEAVTAHHGSLAKEHRLAAEQRLKSGSLRALVATASLELGIDIGDIDLVCQVGSCRGISVFLQRVGRSGHAVHATPKGRLFPLSRDDLVECVAILDAVNREKLDQLSVYPRPLDVLAQQLVAEIAGGERSLDDLYAQFTRAWPYADLARQKFDEVVQMLADGFSTRRGRRSAYLHLDAVNGRVRPRRSARLTAITNGGTIPDQFDYDVVLEPEGFKVGTLNEDFSFESLPGDIFQLGNTSYQILRVEPGKVVVRDAHGQPPNIPFWFGEAPGRSDVLSEAVSGVREQVQAWLPEGFGLARTRAREQFGLSASAATQLIDYLGAAWSALQVLPTTGTVIFERFFDEAGDQHLVIHSTFGSRVNRAWGLALRKRFCRKFNFELQAAALEDTLVLSLGSTHSFPLEEVAGYLKPATVRKVLTQALLDAPMFPTHWRWNASIALAVQRFRGGKKNPPQFQRSDAEDLVAVVFPDQIACQENIAGDREIPDHPLIEQTLYDCLNDLMDISHLEHILAAIHSGDIRVECRDLVSPSPLSEEVLGARPYAFLDDAPAEERRTSLVSVRQFLNPEDAGALGQLDREVIEEVRREAWPDARDADECHDSLLVLGVVGVAEAAACGWQHWLAELAAEGRVTLADNGRVELWVAAERLVHFQEAFADSVMQPPIEPVTLSVPATAVDALTELVRYRLQGSGPVTAGELAGLFGIDPDEAERALLLLEAEGYVMRGRFEPDVNAEQWCERGLLARIHRRTIRHLRKQVQPVGIASFMRFLFDWHGVDDSEEAERDGAAALATVLDQLEGVDVPAGAWESEVLPLRLKGYQPHWLDGYLNNGSIRWARLSPPENSGRPGRSSTRVAPVSLVRRREFRYWQAHNRRRIEPETLSAHGRRLHEILLNDGARYFDELLEHGGWLKSELEGALGELVTAGLVTSDSFSGLRALISRKGGKPARRSRSRPPGYSALDEAGRWSLLGAGTDDSDSWESIEYIAGVLLRRYGIVFRRILDLERNLPSWRELQYVFRRMEARGEVRGGRFVNGFSGEQFALPEAVASLRRIDRDTDESLVSISAADPLNLTGVILPGDRVTAISKNRILFRGGKPVATLTAGEITWLEEMGSGDRWSAQQKLVAVPLPAPGKYRHQRHRSLH